MHRTLKAIVVGLGYMGSRHARVLSQIEDIKIAAVVDPNLARREQFAHHNPRTLTFTAIEEALECVNVDFACLAAPTESTPAIAEIVIDAGIPMLIEKPIATDEDVALELARKAEMRGVLFGVGYVERCNPAVQALKERLEEGMIGRIHQLQARRLSPFPDRDSTHGVAIDLATHDIDVMRYLTGAEIERVFSESGRRLSEGSEDLIAVTMRFDNDSTALLEVNWLTPRKVRELTVTGEDGAFTINYLTQELYFYGHPTERTNWDALANMRGAGEGDMVRYALPRREPLQVQWERFLLALDDDGELATSGYDGYAALSTARAIQLSGACHRPISPRYRDERYFNNRESRLSLRTRPSV